MVAEVTKGLDKPLDKARALTYWVRRNVRYVSAGEKHDYTPHQPAQVLANRYGDCKDTSQLLAVMLKEAGVTVALATLGTLDDGQVLEAVPSPWGTHAILLLTIDGKQHWVDTTASLAAWDYLPRDDRDRLCYVVDDKGLRLVRTPAFTPEQNRTVNHTKITVAADGSSKCERHTDGYGAAAHLRRTEWVEVPPGERRRGMAAELQNAQSKARLLRFSIDEKEAQGLRPARGVGRGFRGAGPFQRRRTTSKGASPTAGSGRGCFPSTSTTIASCRSTWARRSNRCTSTRSSSPTSSASTKRRATNR